MDFDTVHRNIPRLLSRPGQLPWDSWHGTPMGLPRTGLGTEPKSHGRAMDGTGPPLGLPWDSWRVPWDLLLSRIGKSSDLHNLCRFYLYFCVFPLHVTYPSGIAFRNNSCVARGNRTVKEYSLVKL
jgi:hypothetical protein